ncbi:MAG: carbon starvation CstA family protein, partial [Planctomycetota bacterium]
TIVLAIFGLVIAAVFKQYPAAILPCLVQIPIAVAIGVYLHRRGRGLLLPSVLALGVMYLTVVFGDAGVLGQINQTLAGLPVIAWVAVLLFYSYVASVLPVWTLLQPRDYINSLQLLTALALIVVGLVAAAFFGGAPPVPGAPRQPLEIVAPMFNPNPVGAPLIFPFLFITIACGAISGFHCLVSSGTSSKQLKKETDAQFVGYGSMVTEGFLATIVILCCVAGLGLGTTRVLSVPPPPLSPGLSEFVDADFEFVDADHVMRVAGLDQWEDDDGTLIRAIFVFSPRRFGWNQENEIVGVPIEEGEEDFIEQGWVNSYYDENRGFWFDPTSKQFGLFGQATFNTQYQSWSSSNGIAATVGAFVAGAAAFLRALGIPMEWGVVLMGVLVASFAGTTLDTACRLQRYVVQELAAMFLRKPGPNDCAVCGYDLTGNVSGTCPECGVDVSRKAAAGGRAVRRDGENGRGVDDGSSRPAAEARPTVAALYGDTWNPLRWLTNPHGAAIFAIVVAAGMAAMPNPGSEWSFANAGKGGLILWPMFGATNQLLGGLAFLVIAFWLWRRRKPVWFVVLPLLFMLAMPAWAMAVQLPQWWGSDEPNWLLIGIAGATLALEAWIIVEAVLLFPKVQRIAETVE